MTVEHNPQTLAGVRIARMIERQPELDNLEIAKRCDSYAAYVERMRYWHDRALEAVARYHHAQRLAAERRAAKSQALPTVRRAA